MVWSLGPCDRIIREAKRYKGNQVKQNVDDHNDGAGVAGYAMYGDKTLEEVTMNLAAGPLQLAATSLILVSPFTKFALTLEPVARGVEELAQKVKPCCTMF